MKYEWLVDNVSVEWIVNNSFLDFLEQELDLILIPDSNNTKWYFELDFIIAQINKMKISLSDGYHPDVIAMEFILSSKKLAEYFTIKFKGIKLIDFNN